MTVWYKQGVCGRLNPQLRKALGRIHKEYAKRGADVYVTSLEEGTHSAGSLHYCGDAVDIRYHRPNRIPNHVITKAAGSSFDVVFEADHIHVEYDPK